MIRINNVNVYENSLSKDFEELGSNKRAIDGTLNTTKIAIKKRYKTTVSVDKQTFDYLSTLLLQQVTVKIDDEEFTAVIKNLKHKKITEDFFDVSFDIMEV